MDSVVNGVLPAAVVECGLILYRGVKQGRYVNNPIPHLPLPADFTAVGIVYGGLAMLAGYEPANKVATWVAIGVTVATFLTLWTSSGAVSGATTTTQPPVITPKGQ